MIHRFMTYFVAWFVRKTSSNDLTQTQNRNYLFICRTEALEQNELLFLKAIILVIVYEV